MGSFFGLWDFLRRTSTKSYGRIEVNPFALRRVHKIRVNVQSSHSYSLVWPAAAVPPSRGVMAPSVRCLYSLPAAHIFMYVYIAAAIKIIQRVSFIWTPSWLLGTRARPGREERAGHSGRSYRHHKPPQTVLRT
jgi:hypothetical protein